MNEQPQNLVLLIPVFNDWKAASILVAHLDAVAAQTGWVWHVLLVDDGSTEACPPAAFLPSLRHIDRVSVLSLRQNLGHQRAIAIGLAYTDAHLPYDAVLVMDGDGEDAPADVPRLLECLERDNRASVVFAERVKRSEGLTFTLFYLLYRLVHRLLTGIAVRVGNFSVIPRHLVGRLMTASDLWNHYAATVFNSRIPYRTVPTVRAARFDGQSKMNFVSLAVHGLSAIAVFRDRVAVRLLIAAFAVVLTALAGLMATVLIRLTTTWAIPGWATMAAGLLVLVLLQILGSMLVFVFVVLSRRDSLGLLPMRDHGFFVAELRDIARRNTAPDAATETR
jgi:glycosyltransferase involved in cell wall biosynthesis